MGLYFGNGLANNINGSDNADIIYGYGADDILNGGLGDDQILGGNGNDLLIGGAGADFLSGGSGSDTADYSGNLADVFISLDHRFGDGRGFGGTAEGDHLVGIENVIGGDGSDDLRGDDNGNILMGGEGEDYLRGFGGNDQLIGGADGDWMFGGTGGDHFDGGQGNDRAIYSDSDAAVTINLALFTASGGDADGDTLQGVEELTGSRYNDDLRGDVQENSFNGLKGNDKLYGLAGDDGLWGDDGNDILEGGADSDYLHGGDGLDTASYRYATESVSIALEGVYLGWGEAGGDQLISIERLMGSEFADFLGGSADTNRLTGRAGNDALFGAGGDDDLLGNQGGDILAGGEGSDSLTGHGGGDVFFFNAPADGGDTLEDFGTGNDMIQFKSEGFDDLEIGILAANRFHASNSGAAVTLNQRFTYETDTGILRYDANGSQGGGVTIIATLVGAPELTASQIEIIDNLLIF